jgi:hypothetical protein
MLAFGTTVVIACRMATRDIYNVFDAHATSKQCHGQKEADNQYGNRHQYPCKRLQAAEAETLKNSGTSYADDNPPEHGSRITGQQVIDDRCRRDQKNRVRRLTESNVHFYLDA